MLVNRRQVIGGALSSTVYSFPTAMAVSQTVEQFDQLWEQTVSNLLAQDLWTDRDAYDTCHHLAVPMHFAFRKPGMTAHRREFDGFFSRFVSAYRDNNYQIENRLNEMQFLFFVSRYVRLKHESGERDETFREVVNTLMEIHERVWTSTAAPHWSHDDFESVEAMTNWKLGDPDTPRDFEKNIVDLEMFGMAIGTDLFEVLKEDGPPDFAIRAHQLGHRVWELRGKFIDGGYWQFQPGGWWDHPDTAYAGHTSISSNMNPKSKPGIAADTSHSHRLPLFLDCYLSSEVNDPENDFILEIRNSLARTFVDKVIVPPDDRFPGYRTTNFMDGYNGVYRWEYNTQGENNGYGPFELSGTFLLGWWSLLRDQTIQAAYSYTSHRFPLSQNEIDVYVGPNTTRERNPIFELPASLQNGMQQVCVICASEIQTE